LESPETLTPGHRVSIALDTGAMCVAEVLARQGDELSLNVLDEAPGALVPGATLTLMRPTQDGLAQWQAKVTRLVGSEAGLRLDGEAHLLQRRAHPRVPASIPVRCRIAKHPGATCTGRAVNLSPGGARVAIDRRVEVGDRVGLDFDGAGAELHLDGRVVMAIPDGQDSVWSVSVAFEAPRPQVAATLAELLAGLATG